MIKASWLFPCLVVCSAPICAEQTDSCAALEGAAAAQCRANGQTVRQEERLERLIQQQQERQNQLDKEQREIQEQLQSMRLQNESLRQQLERETANPAARPVTTDYSKNSELKSWRVDNPWFGSDYAKTQFAMRYVKQLQQERPELAGRDLLDALSTKVHDTFDARH